METTVEQLLAEPALVARFGDRGQPFRGKVDSQSS
jgi:hypothetical protein